MARLTSLKSALNDDDDQVSAGADTPADDGDPTEPAAAGDDNSASSPAASSARSGKATTNPRKSSRGTGAATGRKTAQRAPRAARSATTARPADVDDTSSTNAGEPLRVRAVDAADAKRVSLYLDPDDYRALALAKLEDGADLNSRVRAMIAVWRGDTRVAKKVDRLAQTAPRGGQH